LSTTNGAKAASPKITNPEKSVPALALTPLVEPAPACPVLSTPASAAAPTENATAMTTLEKINASTNSVSLRTMLQRSPDHRREHERTQRDEQVDPTPADYELNQPNSAATMHNRPSKRDHE
jgi:hypothetical protein